MYHKSFVQGLGNTVIIRRAHHSVSGVWKPVSGASAGPAAGTPEGDFPDDLLCVLFRFRNRSGGGVRLADEGNGGYFNNMLISMGIIKTPIPWMEQQPFVWVALTVATVWWTIGYNMMLFVNALNEIDTNLYEASAMDGAGSGYSSDTSFCQISKRVFLCPDDDDHRLL